MTEEPGLDNPAYVSSVEEGELVTNSSDSGRSNRTRGESDGRVSGNGLSVFPGIVLCRILVVESSRNVFFFFKGEMVLVVLAATQCPVLQREMKL